MKVVNQVNETNDYTMFKTLKGNRVINKLHVERLKKSFNVSYLLSPIIVNEKYEIIDGQHRFSAAQALGLPIFFITVKNYGLKEVQMLNANMKNWKKLDYLHAYCDLGYKEYLKMKKFMSEYKDFGMSAVETILTNSLGGGSIGTSSKELKGITDLKGNYRIRYFQEGDLVIPDLELSIENAEKILMIKPYYDGFYRPVFVRAMIGIFKIPGYSHSQFLNKLSFNRSSLQHCTNVTQYKLLIEDIYNYKSREKVSLRF